MNCPHCKVEIDKHEAAQCLDAWIAERVMGWEYLKVGYIGVTEGDDAETPRQRELDHWMDAVSLDQIGEYYIDVENNTWVCLKENWQWSGGGAVFAPSTNMSDAWKILERLHEQDWEYSVSPNHAMLCHKEWITDSVAQSRPVIEAKGDVPLAVCRAALKAKARGK